MFVIVESLVTDGVKHIENIFGPFDSWEELHDFLDKRRDYILNGVLVDRYQDFSWYNTSMQKGY